jgi:glycosyltransferase involved in cell wall biosynthesis
MQNSSLPDTGPKVSVLMITYNHEKFVAQAIESVLMQKTSFQYELVIGEDCSTDGTREIVREYARRNPTVIRTLLPETNIGMHQNLRQVFLGSRGRYLAILEGDDYWTSPEKLQIQADELDAHPETAVCGHRAVWRYEDGSKPDKVRPEIPDGFYQLEDLLRANFLVTGSVMFRRVIDDVPSWHWSLYMADLPLFVTLAHYGNIRLLPQTMGAYRVHAGGFFTRLNDVDEPRHLLAMCKAFYDHLDPKYRPPIRQRLFTCAFHLGIGAFTAGQPELTRKCLGDCCKSSGAFEHLPQKLLLAIKGYGWWAFPVWRRVPRLWRKG